jgi:hypothetical protein
MKVSPSEAEDALASVQDMMQKTRHSIAASGAYISLIVTGIVGWSDSSAINSVRSILAYI